MAKTTTSITTTVSALVSARYSCVMTHPYYADELYALTPVELEGSALEEMRKAGIYISIDQGYRLYLDTETFAKRTVKDAATDLIHEINHNLRRHSQRSKSLCAALSMSTEEVAANHRALNICADMEINDDLEAERLPGMDNYVTPQKLKMPSGLSMEEYFQRLPQKSVPTPQGAGQGNCGSSANGQKHPWELPSDDPNFPGLSEAEGEVIQRGTAKKILEASRERGNVPGGLARWAEDKLTVKFDPMKELRSAVRNAVIEITGKTDFSWRKRSRRSPDYGVLPGTVGKIPQITVVIDTSGSMDENALAEALAMVSSVLRSLGQQDGLKIISCDTTVGFAKKVFKTSQIELTGGGGTSMVAGLNAAVKSKPTPHAIILITDGYTDWPREPLAQELIVALAGTCRTSKSDCPSWAKVIDLHQRIVGDEE